MSLEMVTSLKTLGCPKCNGALKTALIQVTIQDHDFGIFPGFRCPRGHEYLDSDAGDEVDRQARELGIVG